MKRHLFTGVLALALLGAAAIAYADDTSQILKAVDQLQAEVAQMQAQIKDLAAKIDLLQSAFAPQVGEAQNKARQKKMRALYEERAKADEKLFTDVQLKQIEKLYSVANAKDKWNSDEAKTNLAVVVQQFPKSNRAGCGVLYLAQMEDNKAEKEKLLLDAINNHADSAYGDGVQVGALARFLLAEMYRKAGKTADADRLTAEIKDKYPGAINHNGELLVNP